MGNLSVTADAVPPPLSRGGFGIPESFSSSPEAPLPGELAAKQTERLYEGKPILDAEIMQKSAAQFPVRRFVVLYRLSERPSNPIK